MKIRTSELTGAALDWAVATALGYTRTTIHTVEVGKRVSKPAPWGFWDEVDGDSSRDATFHPSSNWLQGGPIIGQELIELGFDGAEWYANKYDRANPEGETYLCGGDGPTPLVAAMRCFCASRLGEEVEIPDELVEN